MLKLVSRIVKGDDEGWSVTAIVKGITPRLRRFLNSDRKDIQEKWETEGELDEIAELVSYPGERDGGAGYAFVRYPSIQVIESKGNQVRFYYSGGLDI